MDQRARYFVDDGRPVQRKLKNDPPPNLLVLRKSLANWYGHLLKDYQYEVTASKSFYVDFLYRTMTYDESPSKPPEPLLAFWKVWFKEQDIRGCLIHHKLFFETRAGMMKFKKTFMVGGDIKIARIGAAMQANIVNSKFVPPDNVKHWNDENNKVPNFLGDVNEKDHWVAFVPGLDRYYFVNNMDVNIPEHWQITL